MPACGCTDGGVLMLLCTLADHSLIERGTGDENSFYGPAGVCQRPSGLCVCGQLYTNIML